MRIMLMRTRDDNEGTDGEESILRAFRGRWRVEGAPSLTRPVTAAAQRVSRIHVIFCLLSDAFRHC